MGTLPDRAPPHSDPARSYPSTPPSLPGGALTWRGRLVGENGDGIILDAPCTPRRAPALPQNRFLSHQGSLVGAAQAL
jgi:hypothetical protein